LAKSNNISSIIKFSTTDLCMEQMRIKTNNECKITSNEFRNYVYSREVNLPTFLSQTSPIYRYL